MRINFLDMIAYNFWTSLCSWIKLHKPDVARSKYVSNSVNVQTKVVVMWSLDAGWRQGNHFRLHTRVGQCFFASHTFKRLNKTHATDYSSHYHSSLMATWRRDYWMRMDIDDQYNEQITRLTSETRRLIRDQTYVDKYTTI